MVVVLNEVLHVALLTLNIMPFFPLQLNWVTMTQSSILMAMWESLGLCLIRYCFPFYQFVVIGLVKLWFVKGLYTLGDKSLQHDTATRLFMCTASFQQYQFEFVSRVAGTQFCRRTKMLQGKLMLQRVASSCCSYLSSSVYQP